MHERWPPIQASPGRGRYTIERVHPHFVERVRVRRLRLTESFLVLRSPFGGEIWVSRERRTCCKGARAGGAALKRGEGNALGEDWKGWRLSLGDWGRVWKEREPYAESEE